LYRDMEKKLKEAKAFQVAFAIEIRDISGKDKRVEKGKGSLLLTRDNKARLEANGDLAVGPGESPFVMVSDGKQIKATKMPKLEGQRWGGPTPKNFHAQVSTIASRAGMWFSLLGLPYLIAEEKEIDPENLRLQVWDFKAGAAEKVGGRDARVVSYKVG